MQKTVVVTGGCGYTGSILVNSLWPRTAIDTAAVRNLFPVPKDQCRKPDIVADAAFYILSNCAKKNTGNLGGEETMMIWRETERKAGRVIHT